MSQIIRQACSHIAAEQFPASSSLSLQVCLSFITVNSASFWNLPESSEISLSKLSFFVSMAELVVILVESCRRELLKLQFLWRLEVCRQVQMPTLVRLKNLLLAFEMDINHNEC